MNHTTANLKLKDIPTNIREAESQNLTSVEQIALKIAYFDGQGVDRWRVHGRREEIETALKNIGMLNADTSSTITNFIDSCRESMGDISEYYND